MEIQNYKYKSTEKMCQNGNKISYIHKNKKEICCNMELKIIYTQNVTKAKYKQLHKKNKQKPSPDSHFCLLSPKSHDLFYSFTFPHPIGFITFKITDVSGASLPINHIAIHHITSPS